MTETSRKTNLEFGVQNNTKSGLNEIKQDLQVIGREAEKSGTQARAAFDGMGKSSEEAAAQFSRSEARMVSGLRSTVEQMEIALRQSQGLADAFQFKAEFRGFDTTKFNPMLERVRELESQLSLVKAAEAEWAAQNAFAKKHLQATELAKASQYASWWAAELDKVEAAERKLASETAFIKSLQSQSDAIGKTRADLLEMQAAQMGISAQAAPYIANLRQAEKGMQGIGMSAKAMDAAMRGVPAQISDIVVSLQGGMPVMTVFLQQGLQLRDMFGGFGEAGKALGTTVLSMVSPLTVAGAAVAALGVAYYQGSKEQDAFVKAIVLTGNASGMTTSQLHEYARQIDAVIGTQAQAAAGLAAFTAAGVQGGDELRRYTQTAIEWERATGQAVEKTAEQFANLQKDPLAAVLKLNEGTNFLTTSVYEQIQALDEQGKKTEAAEVAMNALDAAMRERAKAIEGSLGYLERAWRGITGAAKEAWDAMLNVGRPATDADQLAEKQAELQRKLTEPLAVDNPAMQASRQKSIDLLNRQIMALQEKMNAESMAAAVSADATRQLQNRIDFDKKWSKALEGEKTLQDKLTAARNEAVAAGKSEADIKTVLAFVTEEHNKGLKKAKDGTKAYNKELSDQQKLIGELSGLSSTFTKDWNDLTKAYARGALSLAQLEKAQGALLAKQPFAVAMAKEEEEVLEHKKKAYLEEVKAQEKLLQQRQDAAQKAQEAVQKARDEEEAYAYAAAAGITLAEAVAAIALARAQDAYQQALNRQADAETLLALQQEIEARHELIELMAQKGVREANDKAAKELKSDWDKVSETIGRTLADYIMGGGKDAATYLKRLFATLVLQPMVNYGVQSLMGGPGGSGAGAAMPGGSLTDWSGWGDKGANWLWDKSLSMKLGGWEDTGEIVGKLGDTLKGVDTWLKDIPGMSGGIGSAAGYLGALVSLSQGKVGSAAGSAIGTWIMPGIGTMIGGVLGSLVDGMFGSGGTQEYGGTAMYSAATGTQTSTAHGAFGTGFGGVDANGQILDNVANISKSIVDALDATAKTFGQTVGYEAAAGFASDFGDDATWGGLRIALNGANIVNWDDTRTSKWAPKEFASGEEGYKQYLNAVAMDAKSVVLGMGIPEWSRQIVAAATDLESFNAALQQIGTVKAVFDSLGQSMQMFSGISGELQTRLLTASGGIEALSTNVGAFYQGFYSEPERMDALQRQLRESLSGLGIGIDPAMGELAKQQFKATVEAAMQGGQAELAAQMMAMSQSFLTAADYAQKASDDSVKRLNEIMGQQHMLYADLAEAQGDHATAVQRRYWIETAGMNAAEQAAYDYIEAIRQQVSSAQAASAALGSLGATQWDLENQLLALQGKTGEVEERTRTKELSELLDGVTDEEKRRQITAAYDYNTALKKQIESLQAAQQAASSAASAQQSAADSIRNSWQQITDSVLGEVKRLRGEIAGSGAEGFATAQADFAIAYAQAMAGDQEAARLLPALSKAVSDLGQSNVGSSMELALLRADLAEQLERLASTTAASQGFALPAFADGGYYAGGAALVGEREPEIINFRNPGYVYDANQTARLLSGAAPSESIVMGQVLAELQGLRREFQQFRADRGRDSGDLVRHTRRTADVLQRVERQDGLAVAK